MLSYEIDKILNLSKISPIVVCGVSSETFGNPVVIDANIASTQLGITNTTAGLKYPNWYLKLKKNEQKTLIINQIDLIPAEEQEKFYELLKYKEISSIALPKGTRIIVTAKDLKNVADIIKRLCMIY